MYRIQCIDVYRTVCNLFHGVLYIWNENVSILHHCMSHDHHMTVTMLLHEVFTIVRKPHCNIIITIIVKHLSILLDKVYVLARSVY